MILFCINGKTATQKNDNPLAYLPLRTMLVSAFLVLISFYGKAQVNAPDFQCVSNDTLVWQIPNNNCGAFNSYEIYFSANPNGPYQLLTSIMDQGQVDFYHNNPAGDTWYYYMQSNFDCPGEVVLSSDTLDNLLPETPRITHVSVNGADVEINWQASNSPEVSSYIIYRTTPAGTIPIDTVSSLFTSYVDSGASPDLQSESYYVIAISNCGNSSVFESPHLTIFVDDFVEDCERLISLNWNLYENWSSGIESQEIWYSVNGSPPTFLEVLSNTETSYDFENTNDGDTYCFFIKATAANTGKESFSNEHCLTLDIVEPVRELFLKNVNVTVANEVELTWLWNNDAEIDIVSVNGRYEGNPIVDLETFSPDYPLGIENARILTDFDASQNQINFTLTTFDFCNSIFVSNHGATIFLSGAPNDDQTNTINWTGFEIDGGTVSSYDIFRMVDGAVTFVANVNGNTTAYSDHVDVGNEAESNVCYFVVADAIIELPDGLETPIKSRSNTICVEQFSNIIAPNAFAPNGINQEFKPVILFGETVSYQMVIYDRWGKTIFETQNQNEGWTGRNGLDLYPSGVYAFYIKIQQMNGRVVEEKGTLMLLR